MATNEELENEHRAEFMARHKLSKAIWGADGLLTEASREWPAGITCGIPHTQSGIEPPSPTYYNEAGQLVHRMYSHTPTIVGPVPVAAAPKTLGEPTSLEKMRAQLLERKRREHETRFAHSHFKPPFVEPTPVRDDVPRAVRAREAARGNAPKRTTKR